MFHLVLQKYAVCFCCICYFLIQREALPRLVVYTMLLFALCWSFSFWLYLYAIYFSFFFLFLFHFYRAISFSQKRNVLSFAYLLHTERSRFRIAQTLTEAKNVSFRSLSLPLSLSLTLTLNERSV